MTGDDSRRTSAITVSNTLAPSLTTLLHRLEAATSRLEDIATSVNTFDTPTGEPVATVNGVPAPSSHAHSPPVPVQTPSAVTSRAITSPASTPTAPAEDLPIEIEEFDKLINGGLAKFIEISGKLDPLLGEQVSLLGDSQNPSANETVEQRSQGNIRGPTTVFDHHNEIQKARQHICRLHEPAQGYSVEDDCCG
jgi:hypothetical protein